MEAHKRVRSIINLNFRSCSWFYCRENIEEFLKFLNVGWLDRIIIDWSVSELSQKFIESLIGWFLRPKRLMFQMVSVHFYPSIVRTMQLGLDSLNDIWINSETGLCFFGEGIKFNSQE